MSLSHNYPGEKCIHCSLTFLIVSKKVLRLFLSWYQMPMWAKLRRAEELVLPIAIAFSNITASPLLVEITSPIKKKKRYRKYSHFYFILKFIAFRISFVLFPCFSINFMFQNVRCQVGLPLLLPTVIEWTYLVKYMLGTRNKEINILGLWCILWPSLQSWERAKTQMSNVYKDRLSNKPW